MQRALIVVTRSFPYTIEEYSFLINEVQHYASAFDRVVLIPQSIEGEPATLPSNIVVDTRFARQRHDDRRRRLYRAATHPLLWKELANKGAAGVAAYRSTIGSMTAALQFAQFFEQVLKAEFQDIKNVLAYTYWFDFSTVGALLIKERLPNLVVVTRAHGGDLYEEDVPGRSKQFFRSHALSAIDRVFCVSRHGQQYLASRYPQHASKITVANLGTPDPMHRAAASDPTRFRIVSCSAAYPIKRVPLIARTVGLLARKITGVRVEWTHIGAGAELDEAERIARETFPSSQHFSLLGQRDHADVLEHFRRVPVDAFINLSVSEGVPLSIMEAQSFGVPVIATAVGGSPSLVNDQNGLLIDPAWPAETIADAIAAAISVPPGWHERRPLARKSWEENSAEQSVYRRFVDALASLATDQRCA